MKNEHVPLILPEIKGYDQAYEMAYTIAREKLATTGDIVEQCYRSATQYQEINSQANIMVRYLNQSYTISLPDITILLSDSSSSVSIKDKLLILHYFNTAKGTPLSNRLITFQELPEGTVYFPTFSKRTIIPLVNYFGNNPQLLFETGRILGGQKKDTGDAAIKIIAFPRVPVTIVIWKGDSELPATGNILFDSSITDYLPTEDIIVLSETITWKLIRSSGNSK